MKKLLLLLVAFATISLTAQVTIYEEDFEGGVLPDGFVLYDVDGQAPNASVNWVTDAWTVRLDFTDDTDNVIGSTSWHDPAGVVNTDDWVVIPQVDLTGATNSSLSFDVNAQDPLFPDGYQVLVSTTGFEIVDFTDVISDVAAANNPWAVQTLDLSAYDGQSIYIAFRNNSLDQFVLLIDDIKVEAASVAAVDDNILSSSVSIYPTAVDTEFTINNRSTIALNTASIYDVNGRLIVQHDLNGLVGQKSISVANLNAGLYFIELTSDNGKAVKKIVKK